MARSKTAGFDGLMRAGIPNPWPTTQELMDDALRRSGEKETLALNHGRDLSPPKAIHPLDEVLNSPPSAFQKPGRK